VKVDFGEHEAVEVVGEMSDREIGRAERPEARNSVRLT